jgi:hypothetical protein
MDEPPRGTGRVVLDSSKKRGISVMGGTLRRVDEKASCAGYSKKEKRPLLLTIFLFLPVSHYPTDF